MTHNPAQEAAAAVALHLNDEQLARRLMLAACPTYGTPDTLRAALMVEAAARLAVMPQPAPRPPARPLWIERYAQAKTAGNN